MNNSLSVEYAIHSIINLALLPKDMPVAAKQLASFMGVTPTYLAKIFTSLSKAGIVKSNVGSKGGIRLARPAEEISFYDVFLAVNGGGGLFQCNNIRAFTLGYMPTPGMCEVHKEMKEAEEKMFDHLRSITISSMAEAALSKLSDEELEQRLLQVKDFMKK
ncbi:HTH-type transcriptional repressor NsrR [compost metagenome]